jgi:hypothetical protein
LSFRPSHIVVGFAEAEVAGAIVLAARPDDSIVTRRK